jgi:hypothetical protein
LDDAEFLKRLLYKLKSQPEEVRRLRADLEKTSGLWRAESGYFELLERLIASPEDSDRQVLMDRYFADRIEQMDLEPVWGATLTPGVYRILAERQHSGSRNRNGFLDSVCFSAWLTQAGIRNIVARQKVAQYFYTPTPIV